MSTTANNVIGAISSAVGAVGSKVSEGFFHTISDKAKNKSNLFSSAGELAKNGNITGSDVDLFKTYINDDITYIVFEEKKRLIIESDLSYEEKQEKLNELLAERQTLRSQQSQQAESISDRKRIKNAVVCGSFLVAIFGLTVAAKKLKVF